VSALAVSVVIPNFNGRRWLPGLLATLAAQTRAADEVIVVDNGSQDGSVQWLAAEHPGVRVLSLPDNTGFAHAANRGLAAAGGALVALVNPDVELAPDWLMRLAARFETPEAAGVGAAACKMLSLADPRAVYDAGDVLRRDGACIQRGRGERDDGRFDEPGEIFGACAGAAMYRRAAVCAVGGFDERYVTYLEDVDLALALGVAGWRCAYEPAVAWHAGEGSSPEPGAAQRWVTRNTALLIATWFPLRWLPQVAYRQAALLGLAARQRRLSEHLRALAGGLSLAAAGWRGRPRTRRRGVVAVDVLVPAAPIRGPAAAGHRSVIEAGWRGETPP
jgi:GT2 family glycosyltransferase